MESEDIEDILFGIPSSQESIESGWNDDSEDDMLDTWDPSATQFTYEGSHATFSPPLETSESMLHDEFEGDDELCSPEAPGEPHTVKDRLWVISRIEQLFEAIRAGLLEEDGDPAILLRTRSKKTRRGPAQTGNSEPLALRAIRFPGGTVQEAWRFTVLVRLLELIHNGLTENVIMTKRDIYYRDPDLFVKQAVVDRYVDDLACTFGISRSLLNVTAAAKGLVAGNFVVQRTDGSSVMGLSEKEGVLVPNLLDSDLIDTSLVRWILVIEKEATFRSLLSSPQWGTLGLECLALTAKGYPDLASRKFLRRIADHSPFTPMFALVDFDPDGIAIMSTYKHGSCRLAHENVTTGGTPTLSLPQLRWLGVQGHQLRQSLLMERSTGDGTVDSAQGVLRLTARDRTKACRMLEWDMCAEDGPEPECRRGLQTMLMLNIKAEMQILEELPGGLPKWLARELGAKQGGEADAEGMSITSGQHWLR